MQPKRKIPYHSQKTSSSTTSPQRNRETYSSSFFSRHFSFLNCCIPSYSQTSSKLIPNSLILMKNHQNTDCLTESPHYSEQVLQANKDQYQETYPNSDSDQKKLNIEETSNKSPFHFQKPCWNLGEPQICMIEYENNLLIGRITQHSINYHDLLAKNHRDEKSAIHSVTELQLKGQKDDLRYTCTNATKIYNPSIIAAHEKITKHHANAGLETRKNHFLNRITCHIAKKLKGFGEILIEPYCKTGIPSIEFAKQGFQVVSLCENMHHSKILYKNSSLLNLKGNINVVKGEFLCMKRLKGDIVFFNPAYTFNANEISYEGEFSIFDNTSPYIVEIIEKSLEVAENLVMLLSKKTDIAELASVFWKVFEKKGIFEHISIKIELIKINGGLELYVIYYGEIAELKPIDEKVSFEKFLLRDYSIDFRLKNIGFHQIISDLSLNTIYRICNQNLIDSNYKENFYFRFLWICEKEKLISTDLYEQLIAFEKEYYNKTTITEKNHKNNEIYSFGCSKLQKLSSPLNQIKLSSSQNSLYRNQTSNFLARENDNNLSFIQNSVVKDQISESDSEEQQFFDYASSYSGVIMNSVSPASNEERLMRKHKLKKQDFSLTDESIKLQNSLIKEIGKLAKVVNGTIV